MTSPHLEFRPKASITAQSNTQAPAVSALPVEQFLRNCHAEFSAETSGHVADYIPELFKADPNAFGIALATIDGYIHEIGDTDALFTIQSVSKAFTFSLALEFAGADLVAQTIGVEPSGEAFNSIRLREDSRPFNPMVNAGAIACSGLIHRLDPKGAFERIRVMLSKFAGRDLGVDDSVYESEQATGDRNRAIAWLLRNNNVLHGDVDAALNVYFRQCAILVNARDLAVMGATLAANGINPITGERVISSATVARTMSVMVSAGMYDYAGEWIYRVGLPAKSGVGGGIVATLPAQLGLGTFSPPLDAQGNSVRGVKVCERLSSHFGLHLLGPSGDVTSVITADYDVAQVKSSRDRNQSERDILDCYGTTARVMELNGPLNFVACDYITRALAQDDAARSIVVFGLRRVTSLSPAAAQLLATQFTQLATSGVRVVLASLDKDSPMGQALCAKMGEGFKSDLRRFASLDEAVGWAEDQIVFHNGGYDALTNSVDFHSQSLMVGLSEQELDIVCGLTEKKTFRSGETLIHSGDVADGVYFLQSGMVSIKLDNGTQVATLGGGTCFGELALLDAAKLRSANVVADISGNFRRLSMEAHQSLKRAHPTIADHILLNLAALLAERLRQANSKMSALSKG